MKVYLMGDASAASGGLYRVFQGLRAYLPVEFVNSVAEADVVHAHVSLYENIPPHVPLVLSSHGLLWEDDPWGKVRWLTNQRCLQSYLQADVVTAPSHFVADTIGRQTLIPTRVVHHGIDTDAWTPGKPQGYVLWNKARQDPANDSSVVNKLAERVPSVNFISTFGTATPNVTLTGVVPPSDMLRFIRGAAVYLDTPRESGGPCFGVLEAMACGVPVLSWDWGGNAEVIRHGETGYLARLNDYQDLVAGLDFCLKNNARLSDNARQDVIEHYRWETVVEGYLAAYAEAIKRQQHDVTVSVVMPCYNLGRFLPHSVGSVINQTYQDWELIIVDDASTDGSSQQVDDIAALDPRIKVIHNLSNRHVSDTRNVGMLNAKGRYLLPLDADDRLEPIALARMVERLEQQRSLHIVSGKLGLFNETDLENGRLGEWPNNTQFDLQIQGYNRLAYCALYRRGVWENIGGYRRRIRVGVEDADFWTRALSYGYRAEILPEPQILNYTLRANSLRLANPDGAKTWLSWFPWSRDPALIPAGATGDGPYQVHPTDRPDVSFVVPVGPGHAHHLQTCVDSILAQTHPNWEIVAVNDTGQRWFENGEAQTPFVAGMPFVHFIDNDKNHGVAHARNLGVKAARAARIVFLDVDDVAQPDMLKVLLHVHDQTDGWVYGDWYAYTGDKLEKSEATDWNIETIRARSLGPITGIYWKRHIEEVGFFDEDLPGWEDWDFHLKLLEIGVCGTRVAFPLITYHMNLGWRREDNFSKHDVLIQYIQQKHPNLYSKEANQMACSRCGGKKTVVEVVGGVPKVGKSQEAAEQAVLMTYTGDQGQTRTFRSPKYKGVSYRINNRKPFYVFAGDIDWFLSHPDFKLAEPPPPPPTSIVTENSEVAILVSQAPAAQSHPLSDLHLPIELEHILQQHFPTAERLMAASSADLLAIKGVGTGRVKTIQEAVQAWTAG